MEGIKVQSTFGNWEGLAIVLAIATSLATAFIFYMSATGDFYIAGTDYKIDRIYNLVLIISCTISAVYAALFAVVVCAVKSNERTLAAIARHLGRDEGKQPASSAQPAEEYSTVPSIDETPLDGMLKMMGLRQRKDQ